MRFLEHLAQCGLNRTEQIIFECLLRQGGLPATRIAKHCALNRTTTYSALTQLESKGLVVEEKRSRVTIFRTQERRRIAKIIKERAQTEFEQVSRSADAIQQQLAEFPEYRHGTIGSYVISSTESLPGIISELEQALLSGDYCGIFDPQVVFTGKLFEVIPSLVEASLAKKPHIREIMVRGPKATWWRETVRANSNHQLRVIDSPRALPTDMILHNGTVVLTDYRSEREMSLRVQHQGYYELMQRTFDELWERIGVK